jgi:hypothetical protein
LGKADLQVTIPGHEFNPPKAKLPQTIDRFQYTISMYGPTPITTIRMDFADYSSTLLVEGASPDQVDAVFSTLRDDLIGISSVIGGPLARFFFQYVVGIILALTTLHCSYRWWRERRPHLLLTLFLSLLCLTAFFFVLPVRDLLAGFSGIQGDASFTVRYGPEISFWALIVGIITIPISYFLPTLRRKHF